MKQHQVTKHAKRSANLFLDTILLLFPAVAGGAIGAGLGRNSLMAGGALLTLANQMKWPSWVGTMAVGMAVNGVSTTKPVTDTQLVAAEVEGEQLGMLPFVPDNFMERGEQYLRNITMKTYLDKVPVVNKFVGLAGIEGNTFTPNAAANIHLNPAARNELNRLMAQRTAGAMSGVDSTAFESLAGVDQAQFEAVPAMVNRDELMRRRAA